MGVIIGYNGDTIASMSSGGTKTLLTADKYCEGDITVEYQGEAMPNYRRYEGTVNADVVGTSQKALLVTSDAVASHYSDASFKVAVTFTPSPEVPYTVIQATGYNSPGKEPYRATSSPDAYQYTYREGSSVGVFTANIISVPVGSSASGDYVGRIICDSQGHVYVMSGSANYGIRRGGFVVEITW